MAKTALALPFSGIHGTLGNTVIVQLPDGPVVRARSYKPRKLSPGQAAAATRMSEIAPAWKALDHETFLGWQRYAKRRAWRNPASGAIVTPRAYGLFLGLASRVRQIDPLFDLAGFNPPLSPFTGDAVRVAVAPAVPPVTSLHALPVVVPGGVVGFAASGANAPGVVTEILAQPMPNSRCRVYEKKYGAKAFVAFGGAETFSLTLDVGTWALAVRFVEAGTGLDGPIIPLGIVETTG